jgi:subtilisin
VEEFTTSQGIADLALTPGTNLDRVYVYGPAGYWGHYSKGLELKRNQEIRIKPVDFSDASLLLGQLYPKLPDDAGKNVIVGIIDSGVAQSHPALRNVIGGVNMVTEEIEAGNTRRSGSSCYR